MKLNVKEAASIALQVLEKITLIILKGGKRYPRA
jgi:hypothetical protein